MSKADGALVLLLLLRKPSSCPEMHCTQKQASGAGGRRLVFLHAYFCGLFSPGKQLGLFLRGGGTVTKAAAAGRGKQTGKRVNQPQCTEHKTPPTTKVPWDGGKR